MYAEGAGDGLVLMGGQQVESQRFAVVQPRRPLLRPLLQLSQDAAHLYGAAGLKRHCSDYIGDELAARHGMRPIDDDACECVGHQLIGCD